VLNGFRKNRARGELFVFLLLCAFLLSLGAPLFAAENGVTPHPQNTADAEGGRDTSGTEGIGGVEADEDAGQVLPEYDYTEPEFGENRTSYSLLILRTVAVLAVIIIAIYFVFRFLLKSRKRVVSDTEMIKVLATYPISANRFIKVVDIVGKILILGVTDSNINLITEVEDKEISDRIKLLSSKEGPGRGTFREQFVKLLGGRGVSRTGDAGYLRGYKDRINKMKKL
jgi:flagellar biosynthetic protein FliO